jgi:general secretion pathway protein D
MKLNIKYKILALAFLLIGNIYAQDSFILNYEDVDIKKVTQDIAQFSKKNNHFRPKGKR